MTSDQNPAPIPELGDGQFHFGLRVNGEVQPRSIDIISLRLAVEEAEVMHRLQKDEHGNQKPTAAFLATLANALKNSAGVANCTPSLAYQLWSVSGGLMDGLKKNMSEPPSLVSGTDSTPANSAEESGPDSTST